MLFKKISAVYSERCMKPINAVCRLSGGLMNVKAAGTYRYHSALKGQKLYFCRWRPKDVHTQYLILMNAVKSAYPLSNNANFYRLSSGMIEINVWIYIIVKCTSVFHFIFKFTCECSKTSDISSILVGLCLREGHRTSRIRRWGEYYDVTEMK